MNTPFHKEFIEELKSDKNWQHWYNPLKLYNMSILAPAEIFLITTNRSSGKTTLFNRMAIFNFKNFGEKFTSMVRFDYQIDGFCEKFFGDIKELFYPDDTLTMKKRHHGKYGDLFLNGILCGHVVPLNSWTVLKEYSHELNDIDCMYFDEFQSETDHYIDNEFMAIRSLHDSFARGRGYVTRYLPLIGMSNNVTIINPLYIGFGIADIISNDTRFLRKAGAIVQNSLVKYASDEQKKSLFNQTCGFNDSYARYSYDNKFLKDINTFIEKPDNTHSRYLYTLTINDVALGVREYPEYIYISTSIDKTNRNTYAGTFSDHNKNTVLCSFHDNIKFILRDKFNKGLIRFQNQTVKSSVIGFIGYK